MTLRLAILISGRGSNMRAIHRSILQGRLDAEIELVLSDQADAPGLAYAREHHLPTALLEKVPGEDRSSYDQRLIREINKHPIDYIVLAGFMRILGAEIVARYHHRILNIHPSLLPNFPGLRAQKQALEAKVPVTGCTVHFVDEGCDTGPIIAQRRVPVLAGDDEASLSARILQEEHRLFSEVLQKLTEGKVKIEGRKVLVE